MIPANEFFYKTAHTMDPRDGVKYATTYYKQTLEERQKLCNHARNILRDINYLLKHYEAEVEEWLKSPLKKHKKKTAKGTYTVEGVLEDLVSEMNGKMKNGLPKDFAHAPINRWNKIFEGCERCQIVMTRGERPKTNIMDLIEVDSAGHNPFVQFYVGDKK